jgi:hypothetical protein
MLWLTKNDRGDDVFFLLCDHRSCMIARVAPAITVNVEEYRLTKKQFIRAAIAEGWWLDFEVMYCPMHAQDMLAYAQKAAEEGSRIVQPAGAEVRAFGGSV